ncbi:MAG: nicotinate-nucleotide adenylyltransferase [Prevotella sp.]|nr:nicotinate-nucleotide adenylyltransferase [Prevotella sp.]
MAKIGIYGGSFNPIHCGHIALARQILRKTRLDQIWFMVSPQNPFKKGDAELWDDDFRLKLVRKALETEEKLVASDYEFRLPRPSYTWDTLQSLSKDFPEHEFTLIIGADNWLTFDRWHRAEDILRSYRIVVYPREGSPIDKATLPPSVTLVDTRLYRLSSTEIRRRLREGKPVKRLVPAAIYDELTASPTTPLRKEKGETAHKTFSPSSEGAGGGL